MAVKYAKPPATRRRFANAWSELEYLCKKVHYWLYQRGSKGKTERYASRLEQVIDTLPNDERAILRQEGLALLYELRGNLKRAMEHRQREIDGMERLHREAASCTAETREYLLRGRGQAVLQDRRRRMQELKKQVLQTTVNGAGRSR